jgi:hypothetical protein
MAFLTVIQGGLSLKKVLPPAPAQDQLSLENRVRELLLDIYCPKIGVNIRDALAVIRDCSIKKLPLATSKRLPYTHELNELGIFVMIASPDEDLDVPLYLVVVLQEELIKAHPHLAEFKDLFEAEDEFEFG